VSGALRELALARSMGHAMGNNCPLGALIESDSADLAMSRYVGQVSVTYMVRMLQGYCQVRDDVEAGRGASTN